VATAASGADLTSEQKGDRKADKKSGGKKDKKRAGKMGGDRPDDPDDGAAGALVHRA
jgi:hypothetical protein